MTSAEVYSQIPTRGAIAALPRAIFTLSGGDRVRYLNGQVSNDIRKLTPETAMYACVMTAKGKMCADVFISEGGDHLLIDAEASLRDDLAARLERYIISDDAALTDVTDDYSLVHVISASAPDAPAAVSAKKSRRYGREGWDVIFKRADFAPAWDSLAEKYLVLDEPLLETLRIEAGIPRWSRELGEEILPNEAGLDRTAIDYHKGCYIGQEVISRIKSVGHVNKTLHGFISDAGAPLQPGMRLHSPEAPGKEAGWITSVAYSFALEKPVALGYLKRGIAAGLLEARLPDAADTQETGSVSVKELPIIP